MKRCLLPYLFVATFFSMRLHAQTSNADSFAIKRQFWVTDSLEALLKNATEDTTKAVILYELSWQYAFNEPEKGLMRSQESLLLSQKLSYKKGIANAYLNAAWCQWALGNYNYSLVSALKSLHLFEELKELERIGWLYLTLANIYRDVGDYQKALQTALQSKRVYEGLHISARVPIAVAGSIYELQNRLDSAQAYVEKARELDVRDNEGKWFWITYLLGNIQAKLKRYDAALAYYRFSLPPALKANSKKDIIDIYNGLANVHKQTGHIDSCIYFANEVIRKWSAASYQKGVLETVTLLANVYKGKDQRDSAIKYLELSVVMNDKLFNQQNQRNFQSLAFNEQMRQDEIVRERITYRNNLKMYALLAAGLLFLVIALLLYRNNQHRQKAYTLLQQQKAKTDQALEHLKSTQAQLIQSEKMASLGELTAGIAHEIQNPLNFVNNFSEINAELIEELQTELKAGHADEALNVSDDIRENSQKIKEHGKRADGIVKGMLQHSRLNTGQKEPTDINKLTDESLRLSFHGLRAKDKTFSADFKTAFDESIGKINVVPQDIGRVLLNLFNNAFYAVTEKKKSVSENYEPRVLVTTKKMKEGVEIRVKDNGMGISKSLTDKIFQPFFTTKPTGQGTGLGLSLSYDIVKAHGGTIDIETKEGLGSTFIIHLPA